VKDQIYEWTLTDIDNELHCYSNEFHSHLPFDKLCFKWEWKFSQLLCPDQTRATVAWKLIKIIFLLLQNYVKYNSYMIEWSKTKYSLRKKMQNNKEFETSPAPLQYNFILLSRLTSTYKVKNNLHILMQKHYIQGQPIFIWVRLWTFSTAAPYQHTDILFLTLSKSKIHNKSQISLQVKK
jgi:hypothetical protein